MADLIKCIKLATELLKSEGLYQNGWRVTLTRAKRGAGNCNYRYKLIGLSKYVIPSMTDESADDTVTHEIAHAIAGHSAGHGWEWQKVHRRLGGNGQRTYNDSSFIDGKKPEVLKPKYVGTCPGGHRHERHKRPTRETSCSQCCSYFNRDYLIRWKVNN